MNPANACDVDEYMLNSLVNCFPQAPEEHTTIEERPSCEYATSPAGSPPGSPQVRKTPALPEFRVSTFGRCERVY